jgi:hypothetical protein
MRALASRDSAFLRAFRHVFVRLAESVFCGQGGKPLLAMQARNAPSLRAPMAPDSGLCPIKAAALALRFFFPRRLGRSCRARASSARVAG